MQKVKKNKKNIRIIPFVGLAIFFLYFNSYAQEIEVSTGKSTLRMNEKFTVSIFFSKEYKREFKAFHSYLFPEISDFEKERTVFIEEEEEAKGYRITQFYKPRKTGDFPVQPVRIKIRDKLYSSPAILVRVKPSVKKPEEESSLPLSEDLEFEETKPEAYFEITTTKKSVYIGEGLVLSASLYIAAQNKAEITFINLTDQRKEFIKTLKSTRCLSEDISPSNEIPVDTTTIKGKKYSVWKIYEGIFYPTDTLPMKVPSLSLKVLAYALAKNKQESIERRTLKKEFASSPIVIKVKSLPSGMKNFPYSVGYFQLSENISSTKLQTGKSFKYTFTLFGEGNIRGIAPPSTNANQQFDIYTPKITLEQTRNGRQVGGKSFVYYVTPKEPGEFEWGQFFKWPYFNVYTGRFDTLKSSLRLKVRGESLKNNYISVNNPGDFYGRIYSDGNQLQMLDQDDGKSFWVNLFILSMLVLTAIIILKK